MRPRRQAGVGGARIPGPLQNGGLGGPEGIVGVKGLQRSIKLRRRLSDVARAHPYQLRQVVLGVDEARLERDTLIQSCLGAAKLALGNEAAGVSVIKRCGFGSTAQDLLGNTRRLVRLVGLIEGNGERMSGV